MTNVSFDSIGDYRDLETLNMYRERVIEGNANHQEIIRAIHGKSRDNARTPIQWDDSENAGFTTGKPWIKVNPNYREINAKEAMEDPNSILHYYQGLIQLRKENLIFVYGDYKLLAEDDPHIFAYLRCLGNEKLLVVLNFASSAAIFDLPGDLRSYCQELLIANCEVHSEENLESLKLKPYEARVYQLKQSKEA